MKNPVVIEIALLLATAAAGPCNAIGTTVQLQVKGAIRPSACMPTLQGAGLINYPAVSYDSLSQTEPTRLDTRDIGLTIVCSAPTRVGIRTIDNRSASKVTLPAISDQRAMYGLGAVGNTPIGAYHIAIGKLEGDDAPLEALAQVSPGSANWTSNPAGAVRPDEVVSWGAAGSGAIGAYRRITATLSVAPVLNRASALPAGQAIDLDGATTIEIVYP